MTEEQIRNLMNALGHISYQLNEIRNIAVGGRYRTPLEREKEEEELEDYRQEKREREKAERRRPRA